MKKRALSSTVCIIPSTIHTMKCAMWNNTKISSIMYIVEEFVQHPVRDSIGTTILIPVHGTAKIYSINGIHG